MNPPPLFLNSDPGYSPLLGVPGTGLADTKENAQRIKNNESLKYACAERSQLLVGILYYTRRGASAQGVGLCIFDQI